MRRGPAFGEKVLAGKLSVKGVVALARLVVQRALELFLVYFVIVA